MEVCRKCVSDQTWRPCVWLDGREGRTSGRILGKRMQPQIQPPLKTKNKSHNYYYNQSTTQPCNMNILRTQDNGSYLLKGLKGNVETILKVTSSLNYVDWEIPQNAPVAMNFEWYFLALLGRKEWKSIRKGKLEMFLQEIWTKDNPNHEIFCFSLDFFLNGLMWGLNDGAVSRGTE